jgi:hypothetical protein
VDAVRAELAGEGVFVHEVIQVGERLAEGEAHLVPVDGCWRSATWGRFRVSIQKWDQRFESAFLQRRVCKLSVPVCSGSTGPMISTRYVMEGSLQALYLSLKLRRREVDSNAWSLVEANRQIALGRSNPRGISRGFHLSERP